MTPEDIKQANNLRRNAVRVGQQLRITTSSPQAVMETTVAAVTGKKTTSASSSQKANTTKAATQKSTPKATTASSSTHTIKKGETLSVIARKYGVTVAALKSANGLKNDNIRAGQKLKIPAKKKR